MTLEHIQTRLLSNRNASSLTLESHQNKTPVWLCSVSEDGAMRFVAFREILSNVSMHS